MKNCPVCGREIVEVYVIGTYEGFYDTVEQDDTYTVGEWCMEDVIKERVEISHRTSPFKCTFEGYMFEFLKAISGEEEE